MTYTDILKWIKSNLASYIDQAIMDAKTKNQTLLYTEDWLGAITCRETGDLIARYAGQGKTALEMAELMKGDYTQRSGETEKQYHGFGFIQVDIGSFPAFIHSGDWQDPLKCYKMAISVLEGKRQYIQPHFPTLTGDALERAITASYNCGEGNCAKCLRQGIDIDSYTTNHNYSKQVFEFREIYRSL